MKPSASSVQAVLNSIQDPCSISVGAPLGLVEMGLVTGIAIADDGLVSIDIRLTSPGCMMGIAYFDHEIKRRLVEVEGVTAVAVGRTHDLTWSEEDIDEEGRERLRAARERRQRF
jgi:metal-sulfur cluster biosynthetic enzyme